MFSVRPNEEQRRQAYNLIQSTNFGNRGEFDGSPEDQFIGILAEIVLAENMNLKRHSGNGFDNGYDFIIGDVKVDLKTMGRTTDPLPNYISNIPASQLTDKYESEVFLFASYNKTSKLLTFIGILPKSEIKREWFHEKGKARFKMNGEQVVLKVNNYEVPYSAVRPVTDWLNIYGLIKHFKSPLKDEIKSL
jgi:hypothetical protein